MPRTPRDGWGYADSGNNSDSPYVVPSRMSGPAPGTGMHSNAEAAPHWRSDSSDPRRVEAEVINGKPVFVLYRPSRGLEVRQDTGIRDTDSMVR